MAEDIAGITAESTGGESKSGYGIGRTVLVIVITGILTVIGTWIKQKWLDPFAITVRTVYISPARESVGLANTHVDPHFNNISGQNTNDDGEVVFQNVEPHWFQKVTIAAKHPGYEYADGEQKRSIPVRKRDDAVTILMQPIPEGRTGFVAPPAVSHPADLSSGRSNDSGARAEVGTSPNLPVAAIISSACHSDLMPSGEGQEFGPLYTLCSDSPSCSPPSPKSGYFIQSEHFSLEGDRQCGAWSECSKIESSTDKVCYSFRMQGHSEWRGPFGVGGGGVAMSRGILNVTWIKE
jgi:hypothetical protein